MCVCACVCVAMAPRKSGLPRKRFYRARAHSNPLSDSQFPVPISPRPRGLGRRISHTSLLQAAEDEEKAAKNSDFSDLKRVRFADIGCGFGGLLVKLSPIFPNTVMVGMELRDKVSEYVKDRILASILESFTTSPSSAPMQ